MADLVSGFCTWEEGDPFGVGALLSPEARLFDAISERNYPRAYAILRKLEAPLEGDRAAECLVQTFSRTNKLFHAVLAHLSPAVRSGSAHVSAWWDGSARMSVSGTLLVLAAALGSETHVKALLARGFDVNAASLESAVFQYAGYDPFAQQPCGPRYRFCAAPGNSLTVAKPGGRSVRINGCTPLAAAIAAGNLCVTDALLAAPGVWKTESSAVCRAAALHADGKALHNWRIRWDGSEEAYRPADVDPRRFLDIRDVLFPYVNMQPASFADFCTPALLRAQYRSGACTDGDARAVFTVLDQCTPSFGAPSPDGGAADKLLLTARHFPAVCREPAQRDVLLRTYLKSVLSGEPNAALLKCWKKLSGPDRDVSCCGRMLFHLRGEQLEACLEALAEGGSLYASADALHPDTVTELRTMLRRIRIVPSPFRSGISSFAKAVVSLSADVRLVRKLLQGGPLSHEPKEALLRAADVRLRPLILTAAFSVPAETYDPLRTGEYFAHSGCLTESECAARAAALLSGRGSELACLPDLIDDDVLGACCDGGGRGLPQIECTCLTAAFLCAENPAVLRAWLRLHPNAADGMLHAELHGGGAMRALCGPPLAVAAAAGRTENIRTLLASDPRPDVCCGAALGGETVPCTPFLLALWFGQEETARLLLDSGARCALDRGAAYRFFRAMPPEGRALAARLPGVGYERAAAREAEGAA